MTLPSVTAMTGIVTGNILTIAGAGISIYTGMLLISCAEKTKSDKYEDFALQAYGRKMSTITSIFIMACLLGIVVSYVTFIKNLIPLILTIFKCGELPDHAGDCHINEFIGMGQWKGQVFWATAYSLLVLFPISIPRNLSSLQFSSLFGFCCSIYLVIVITLIFFFEHNLEANGERVSVSEALK